MQPSQPIGLGRLYSLLFLLVPGYAALRGYLLGGLILDDLSRTDKLLSIITGGLVSLTAVVFLHRVNTVGWVLWFYESISRHLLQIVSLSRTFPDLLVPRTLVIPTIPWNDPVKLESLRGRPILEVFAILSLQSVVGLVAGFAYGRKFKIDSATLAEALKRNQPWDEVSEYARRGMQVTVVTNQGREIAGQIEQIGSPSEDYDLLLGEPEEVQRTSWGHKYKRRLGYHSYHHYRDISRIEFEEEFEKDESRPWFVSPIKELNDWLESLPQKTRVRCSGATDRIVGFLTEFPWLTGEAEGETTLELEEDD